MATRATSSVKVDIRSAERDIHTLLRTTTPTSLAGYLTSIASPHFSRRANERFNQGDNASGAWAQLSEATKEIRHNLGYYDDKKINERTGKLKKALIRPSIRVSQDIVGTTMEWPSGEAEYGMKERLAQAAGRRKGPARYVIAYDLNDVAYLLNTMEAFVMTGNLKR